MNTEAMVAVTDSPLMKNYYKNTDASKGIALAEYVAISLPACISDFCE
jgi:hypothetical protein